MKSPNTPWTIASLRAALDAKEISAIEVALQYQKNAQEHNGDINAYIEIFDDIQAQAQLAQVMIDDGRAGMLTGIPISMKDNICIEGKVAAAASKIFSNHKALYDSSVAAKLKKDGVVFMGRANMDEFAMGSSCETSAFGKTKNPLDTSLVPGGSSGGSAASVAMGGALASFGSDTAGSVRLPAAFCGLVGMYPTYGTVSRYGLIAMGSSLDQIAPMAPTVADVKALWQHTAFYDPLDNQSVPTEKRLKLGNRPLRKKVGIPTSLIDSDTVSAEVKANIDAVRKVYQDAGYEVIDIELPHANHAVAIYYILVTAEISSNLARFDGVRYGNRASDESLQKLYMQTRGQGFGAEVRRRILLGTYALSDGYADDFYRQAVSARLQLRRDTLKIFEEVDAIIMPTSIDGPFKLGEVTDPLTMYLQDLFTVIGNLTQCPAISVPHGHDKNGMPLGVQVMCPHFGEHNMFTMAQIIEDAQNQ